MKTAVTLDATASSGPRRLPAEAHAGSRVVPAMDTAPLRLAAVAITAAHRLRWAPRRPRAASSRGASGSRPRSRRPCRTRTRPRACARPSRSMPASRPGSAFATAAAAALAPVRTRKPSRRLVGGGDLASRPPPRHRRRPPHPPRGRLYRDRRPARAHALRSPPAGGWRPCRRRRLAAAAHAQPTERGDARGPRSTPPRRRRAFIGRKQRAWPVREQKESVVTLLTRWAS